MRLAHPFDELSSFAHEFDMESLDDTDHKHVPYAIIILKQLQIWKDNHDDSLPKNFAEKDEFKAQIKAAARNWGDEENFEQAIENTFKIFTDIDPVPYQI